MSAPALSRHVAGVPLPGLAFPRPRPHKHSRFRPPTSPHGGDVIVYRLAVVPRVGTDVIRRVAVRPAPVVPARPTHRVRWVGLSLTVILGIVLGAGVGLGARQYMDQPALASLPAFTAVQPQPLFDAAPTDNPPAPPPDHVLLQVPFTTQAPLGNWAQHQESCEAATLTMLVAYWRHDPSLVIDSQTADSSIHQIDAWKSQPDLNDQLMGELAQQHFGFGYRIVPNDPKVIAEQLAAGRPLIAEVRTHGLGNGHYPGYNNHYEQTGWSVPHFVLIIGYDSTGVWLNDAGISWGRGYHITYAQLAHAIDDLDQHHPALAQGQVLLLIAPEAPTPRVRPAKF
jgi:peptidase C39-like protein